MNLDAETQIVAACHAGDFKLASELAFVAYGPEIYSFVCARLRAVSEAQEVFSIFAEDMCNALPAFAFRCSVRGYLYTLARNAVTRYVQEPNRRSKRNAVTMNSDAVLARVRTTTQMYRRTDVKSRVRALREQLPDEDQMLLQLHIDRGLPWAEIAMVMLGEAVAPSAEEIGRESARLRKRFERVKAELRDLARAEGLLKT